MTLQLICSEVVDAVADLHRAADELRAHRRAAERSVGRLLDGGWAGAAAGRWSDGWQEWDHGSAAVVAGLETVAELLDGVRVRLEAQDAAASLDLGRLLGEVR